MFDKIREVIEMHDSLVEFKGGKEHCILPEHYDELAKEIVKNKIMTEENKNTEKQCDIHVVIPCFSKEQVIKIVAEFGRTYNTESFLGSGETLEEAIKEVKDMIDWDIVNKA